MNKNVVKNILIYGAGIITGLLVGYKASNVKPKEEVHGMFDVNVKEMFSKEGAGSGES